MKKVTYFLNVKLSVVMTLLSFTGCQKYLDLKPSARLDAAYVFSNVAGAKSALMGVYSQLLIYQNGPIRFFPYTADDVMGNFNGALDNAMRSIHRYDLRASNTQLAPIFDGLYVGIDRANVCIREIPLMSIYTSGTDEQKAELKRILGEALTLRSLFYFDLIRNWGDVPASFLPSSEQTDLFLEKTDRQVIYNRIIEDLKEASELLPWRNDAGVTVDERITKGAAKALRARVALFAGGYSLRKNKVMERASNWEDYYRISNEECKDLDARRDKHTLNPSFENVFKTLTSYKIEANGEVMFEIGFSVNNAGTLGYFDGPRYTYPGMTTQGGAAQVYVVPSTFYAFAEADKRRDVTAAPYQTDFVTSVRTVRPLSTLPVGKFRVDWTIPALNSANLNTGINWPIIRFSDVLLMLAETENALSNGSGPTAIAKRVFEEVRTRGYGGNASAIGTTPTDAAGFQEAIEKERLLEFTAEGIRKYDLIRWNKLASKIQSTKNELTKMKDRVAPYRNTEKPLTVRYLNNSFEIVWQTGSSFYTATPSGAVPTGYTNVAWVSAITQTLIDGYAPFFEANKHELLPIPQTSRNTNPKLTQDYGY